MKSKNKHEVKNDRRTKRSYFRRRMDNHWDEHCSKVVKPATRLLFGSVALTHFLMMICFTVTCDFLLTHNIVLFFGASLSSTF